MIKQAHSFGCIPACALEVMSRLDPSATLPCELALLKAMAVQPQGLTGFAKLALAVRALGLPFNVTVEERTPPVPESELQSVANSDALPLAAIEPWRLDPANVPPDKRSAHCLVMLSHDDAGQAWRALDPDPGAPDPAFVNGAKFSAIWCKGYALITKR